MLIHNCTEYNNLVAAYSTKKGRFDYDRFGKDLIRMADGSRKISEAISRGICESDILLELVEQITTSVTKSYKGTEERNAAIYMALDTKGSRGAFGAVKRHLRMMAKRSV
jgi:hypothetical protein